MSARRFVTYLDWIYEDQESGASEPNGMLSHGRDACPIPLQLLEFAVDKINQLPQKREEKQGSVRRRFFLNVFLRGSFASSSLSKNENLLRDSITAPMRMGLGTNSPRRTSAIDSAYPKTQCICTPTAFGSNRYQMVLSWCRVYSCHQHSYSGYNNRLTCPDDPFCRQRRCLDRTDNRVSEMNTGLHFLMHSEATEQRLKHHHFSRHIA